MIKALEKANKKFEKPQRSPHREKEVKEAIKEIVKEMAPYNSHVFMPVQTGFGRVDLDFIIILFGRYLTIEAKANGLQPTGRQIMTMKAKVEAGAVGLYLDQKNLSDLVHITELLIDGDYNAAMLAAEMYRERYLER